MSIVQNNHLSRVKGLPAYVMFFSTSKAEELYMNLETELDKVCKEIRPCITIHVFAYQRLQATRELLEALSSSDYSSYSISSNKALPLVMHLDRPTVNATEQENMNFLAVQHLFQDFPWQHGPKLLDLKVEHVGLKASWLAAWPGMRPDDILIAFEDDVIPSPLYFQWLLKILNEYNLWRATDRDPSLLGISLSPVRVNEIIHPFQNWRAHELFPEAEYPVYLNGLPSSWGAVFWGNVWRQFLEFDHIRESPLFHWENEDAQVNSPKYAWGTNQGDPNLWLPQSTTNSWIRSWKRFLVDFAYGRGAYMIYPNIGSSAGLATSRFSGGDHYEASSVSNPRQAPLLTNKTELRLHSSLPEYESLPLVDIYGGRTDRLQYAKQGDVFLSNILSLGSFYGSLIEKWRRPCLLDNTIDGQHSGTLLPRNSFEKDFFFFLPPQEASLYEQMMLTLQAVCWARTLGRKLILLPFFSGLQQQYEDQLEEMVPFSMLFSPQNYSSDVTYLNPHQMAKWKRPERMATMGPGHSMRTHTFVNRLQWQAIPQINVPTKVLTSSISFYIAFGSCRDVTMIMTTAEDGYKDVTESVQPNHSNDIFQEIFKPARIVEHFVDRIKENMEFKYACLEVDLDDRLDGGYLHMSKLEELRRKASEIRPLHLLIVSDYAEKARDILKNIPGKQIHTKKDTIDSYVDSFIGITLPDASSAIKKALAAVVETKVCAEADWIVLKRSGLFSTIVQLSRTNETNLSFW